MSSLLPTILFLSTPVLYFTIEHLVAKANTQPYSYTGHFTSALAYPYLYRDRDTNALTLSPRAYLMKANFILNGLFHLSAQLLFIDNNLTWPRKIAAVLYCIGIVLVALDSGNTGRPKGEKKAVWHGLGALLAILSGNLGSVLAGVASEGWYGWVSVGLGLAGFWGFIMWARNVEGQLRGLWQRSAIYPIMGWMGVTGVWLVLTGQAIS